MTDLKANISQLQTLVEQSQTILILQPDSPDGDSIGTALGLEEILGDLGKSVVLYSYKEPEPYLRFHDGWDRVSQDWPKVFDFTIIVDTGAPTLIKSALDHYAAELMAKPVVVIDHHTNRSDFGFKTVDLVDHSVATAELVTQICLDLGWAINDRAAMKLAAALLSDSLNLTTSGTTAHSVAMYAKLTASGASPYELSRQHKAMSALGPSQVHLKGQLLSSIEFLCDGELAVAEITPDVVAENTDKFEPYNMIISDMQWTTGVKLAAVFKNYGTKINVPMRSAAGAAGPVATLLGGGGHPNAGAWRCETLSVEGEKQRLVDAYLSYRKDQPHEGI